MMIQIMMVSDHRLFRSGLKLIFKNDYPDLCITGEADDGDDLFCILPDIPADIVILDINQHSPQTVEIVRRLHIDYPHLKILAIAGDHSDETIKAMLEEGIDGVVSKRHDSPDKFAETIRSTVNRK